MLKNSIIGLLVFISLAMAVYGMVQQAESVKAKNEALANAKRADNEARQALFNAAELQKCKAELLECGKNK